mmetsp:Transcript_17899/g.50686  ORF Transcript_17899/g.50686 Transcript_17899/m.50686 type:complete len:481 (+) Transcript_17899:155-1597(+)
MPSLVMARRATIGNHRSTLRNCSSRARAACVVRRRSQLTRSRRSTGEKKSASARPRCSRECARQAPNRAKGLPTTSVSDPFGTSSRRWQRRGLRVTCQVRHGGARSRELAGARARHLDGRQSGAGAVHLPLPQRLAQLLLRLHASRGLRLLLGALPLLGPRRRLGLRRRPRRGICLGRPRRRLLGPSPGLCPGRGLGQGLFLGAGLRGGLGLGPRQEPLAGPRGGLGRGLGSLEEARCPRLGLGSGLRGRGRRLLLELRGQPRRTRLALQRPPLQVRHLRSPLLPGLLLPHFPHPRLVVVPGGRRPATVRLPREAGIIAWVGLRVAEGAARAQSAWRPSLPEGLVRLGLAALRVCSVPREARLSLRPELSPGHGLGPDRGDGVHGMRIAGVGGGAAIGLPLARELEARMGLGVQRRDQRAVAAEHAQRPPRAGLWGRAARRLRQRRAACSSERHGAGPRAGCFLARFVGVARAGATSHAA